MYDLSSYHSCVGHTNLQDEQSSCIGSLNIQRDTFTSQFLNNSLRLKNYDNVKYAKRLQHGTGTHRERFRIDTAFN
jgi:hypothetical protein